MFRFKMEMQDNARMRIAYQTAPGKKLNKENRKNIISITFESSGVL